MYVIVRGDLSPGLSVAQAIHAATGYCLAHPKEAKLWNNHTVVVLRVRDEDHLWRIYRQLDDAFIFLEPDLGDAATALAAATSNTKFFKHLPLLGEEVKR